MSSNADFYDATNTLSDTTGIRNDSTTDSRIVTSDKRRIQSLNFNKRNASFVLNAIVQQDGLRKAEKMIKRENGRSMPEKL